MKTCRVCKAERPESDFTVRNGKSTNWCRPCKREYDKQYHLNRPEEKRLKKYNAKVVRQNELRQLLWDYKASHSCVDCYETDPIVLEFDHNDEVVKDNNICNMVANGSSWSKILLEIGKCVVRCANCHRRRTHKQFGWFTGS